MRLLTLEFKNNSLYDYQLQVKKTTITFLVCQYLCMLNLFNKFTYQWADKLHFLNHEDCV